MTSLWRNRVQGRVISIIHMVAMSLAASAPILSGIVLAVWSAPVAVLVFAAAVAGSALAATFSRGIRQAAEQPEPVAV